MVFIGNGGFFYSFYVNAILKCIPIVKRRYNKPCFENEFSAIAVKKMFQNYSECILSYGENCQHRCNVNCINETCDRFNGSCLYGCKYGKQCDKGKLV